MNDLYDYTGTSIPSFDKVKTTPGYVYVVEHDGTGYTFEELADAARFADENNHFLVEGVR